MITIPKTQHTGGREFIVSHASAAVSFVFVFACLFFITGIVCFGGEVTEPGNLFGTLTNFFTMWSGPFLMGATAALLSLLSASQTLKLLRGKT